MLNQLCRHKALLIFNFHLFMKVWRVLFFHKEFKKFFLSIFINNYSLQKLSRNILIVYQLKKYGIMR
tara:strand:+ start:2179 stop:2379 length:201 start_codon:yes stop_codon:yes gene_type:complete